MSQDLISRLPLLQNDSGTRLPTSVIYGFTARRSQNLIRTVHRNGEYVGVPSAGAGSVMQRLQYKQRLMVLDNSQTGFMRGLNRELKGGSSYPVLTFALGTAVGVASGGAGLIFGAATLALDLSRRSTDVLARKGDEIWAIEEIGKIYQTSFFSADGHVAQHVMSFFLVDPFRAHGRSPEKGWLIHESRSTVSLDD